MGNGAVLGIWDSPVKENGTIGRVRELVSYRLKWYNKLSGSTQFKSWFLYPETELVHLFPRVPSMSTAIIVLPICSHGSYDLLHEYLPLQLSIRFPFPDKESLHEGPGLCTTLSKPTPFIKKKKKKFPKYLLDWQFKNIFIDSLDFLLLNIRYSS